MPLPCSQCACIFSQKRGLWGLELTFLFTLDACCRVCAAENATAGDKREGYCSVCVRSGFIVPFISVASVGCIDWLLPVQLPQRYGRACLLCGFSFEALLLRLSSHNSSRIRLALIAISVAGLSKILLKGEHERSKYSA